MLNVIFISCVSIPFKSGKYSNLIIAALIPLSFGMSQSLLNQGNIQIIFFFRF